MVFKYIAFLATIVSLVLFAAAPVLADIPGDFDQDGDVDVFDFGIWQRNPGFGNLLDWRANFSAGVSSPGSIVIDQGPPNGEVSLSLNLYPNDVSNPSAGGVWDLVAKTTSDGISAIMLVLNDVPSGSIILANDIGAMLVNPISLGSGPTTQLVYGQDINDTSVPGVGTPSFGGAVPVDPFGDTNWNFATSIASGNYGAILPSFGDFGGVTQANVFDGGSNPVLANGVSLVVRTAVPEPSAATMLVVGIAAVLAIHRIPSWNA